MAKIITFGNFKGGTGKTTNSCMIADQLAKKGNKTLVVDLDPQANATSLLSATKRSLTNEVVNFDTTLMTAVNNGDISNVVNEIKSNLYLMPNFADWASYPLFLEKKFPDSQYDRATYFSKLLKPIEDEFEYIIIDTPPTISLFTDSALMASNYILIVLQTQQRSFDGAETYIDYAKELIQNYGASYEIIGILPVLMKNKSQVDDLIIEKAREVFDKSNVFDNIVKSMERLKRYDIIGITDPSMQKHDIHDNKINNRYSKITDEFVRRINNAQG